MKADDEVDDGDSMAAYGEGDTGKYTLRISATVIKKTCILGHTSIIIQMKPAQNL